MAIMDRIFSSKRDSFEITSPYRSEEDDCLSCRLMGSATLVGLSGYTYFSGMSQLRQRKTIIEQSASRYKYGSRQLGIVMLSLGFFGGGVWRLFN